MIRESKASAPQTRNSVVSVSHQSKRMSGPCVHVISVVSQSTKHEVAKSTTNSLLVHIAREKPGATMIKKHPRISQKGNPKRGCFRRLLRVRGPARTRASRVTQTLSIGIISSASSRRPSAGDLDVPASGPSEPPARTVNGFVDSLVDSPCIPRV